MNAPGAWYKSVCEQVAWPNTHGSLLSKWIDQCWNMARKNVASREIHLFWWLKDYALLLYMEPGVVCKNCALCADRVNTMQHSPVFVNDVCEHNSTIKSGKCPGTPKNVTPPTLELPYKGFFGEGSYQICENGMASLFRAEGRCPP